MKRLLLILMTFLLVSGCDDTSAKLEDVDFQSFEPGTTTLEDVKSKYPHYSEEFVWQGRPTEDADSDLGAEVTLVYHTRKGHYFMRFEKDLLVAKRKLPH